MWTHTNSHRRRTRGRSTSRCLGPVAALVSRTEPVRTVGWRTCLTDTQSRDSSEAPPDPDPVAQPNWIKHKGVRGMSAINHRKARDVSGLEDWELELLFELRILREANGMGPVLEAMAACLAALYLEGQRLAWEKQQAQRAEDAKRLEKGKTARVRHVPVRFIPDNEFARRLIAEQTASGRWVSRLDRELSREIIAEMHREIAAKAKLA